MQNTIHHPHDKMFFKALKEDPRVAQDFLQAYLPQDLLAQADLNSIKLYHSKMVSPQYKKFEADIIYEIQLRQPLAGQLALFMLHCEHYAEAEDNAPLRTWQYLLLLAQEYRTLHPSKPLPLIYPIIVYSGKSAYNKSTSLFDLFGIQKGLAKQYLLEPIKVIDVCRLTDEDMRKRLWFGLVEFAFKYRHSPDFTTFIDKFLPWIKEIELQQGTDFAKLIIYYILDNFNEEHTNSFLNQATAYFSNELEGETMTMAERLKQDGWEQGLEQGLEQEKHIIAARLLAKGFPLTEIVDITGLSSVILQKLQEEQR